MFFQPYFLSTFSLAILRTIHLLIKVQLSFNVVAFCSHGALPIQPEQCGLFIFPWFDGINFTLILRIIQTHHVEMDFLCADLYLLADACKRGDVTVEPSRVISLGSAVNISCSLKPEQGCSQYPSFNELILYRFKRRINFLHGHFLSSQVTDLPLGTTVFFCKLACSKNKELQICGAEILVGGEHSILNS